MRGGCHFANTLQAGGVEVGHTLTMFTFLGLAGDSHPRINCNQNCNHTTKLQPLMSVLRVGVRGVWLVFGSVAAHGGEAHSSISSDLCSR
jgi:hypothetical protein